MMDLLAIADKVAGGQGATRLKFTAEALPSMTPKPLDGNDSTEENHGAK